LILINKEIKLSISIDGTLLKELTDIGKSQYPDEFGGFLIGNYSDDLKQLNITDTILPTKYKATKYQFERETDGINETLKNYYEQTPKTYYVGEWHTHPDNISIPSTTDISAINNILNYKGTSIQNPVLLIIGYNKQKVEFGFYVAYKNKLYKYE
jgi:[CysO sulfur-carrier protein]-S-L-cysteine hydrolase